VNATRHSLSPTQPSLSSLGLSLLSGVRQAYLSMQHMAPTAAATRALATSMALLRRDPRLLGVSLRGETQLKKYPPWETARVALPLPAATQVGSPHRRVIVSSVLQVCKLVHMVYCRDVRVYGGLCLTHLLLTDCLGLSQQAGDLQCADDAAAAEELEVTWRQRCMSEENEHYWGSYSNGGCLYSLERLATVGRFFGHVNNTAATTVDEVCAVLGIGLRWLVKSVFGRGSSEWAECEREG
jgi:hypothetical protein